MNRNSVLAILATVSFLALPGCADMTPEQRQLSGQVAVGVTGAAIGSRFGGGSGRVVATGAGAVLGTVVGGHVAQ